MRRTIFSYQEVCSRLARQAAVVLALPVLLAACHKGFSSDQFEDDKLVVLAEITAGDSIKIPVGKTIKVGNGAVIRFEKVNDATATITEENSQSWILQPSYAAQFAANPTTVFTNRKRLKANTHYTLEIKHPILGTAKATAYIPALPKIISLDTASQVFQGKNVLAATICWQDVANKEEYYIIEAVKELVKVGHYFYYRNVRYDYDTQQGKELYNRVKNSPGVRLLKDTIPQNKFVRLSVFTQDDQTENARIDNLNNPFRRIFIPDRSFDGQSYTTRVFVDKQFFTAIDPADKGRIRLQFKSAGKELYNYLLLYEKYKTDFGSVPANQLVSPEGNIQNNLGIFGGTARRERLFYFDALQ